MTTTVTYRHPAGHGYLHAVLVLQKIIIRPESGVFDVEYGIWENESAFTCNAEPLHTGAMTYAIHSFASLSEVLNSVTSYIIQDNANNIVIPEEENQ